jgi:uncharacterized protein (TIGR03086 family)
MTTSANPFRLLSRALDQTDTVIDGVGKEQATLPTPCRAWDVRALVDHVIHDLGQFAVAATGGRPDWRAAAPSVDGDWGGAFRDGARVLLAAWRRASDLSGTIQLPIGEVPATFVVNQQIAEFAVHSWDLARATGQVVELDPEIGEAALAWARTALRPEFRGDEDSGKAFGPEVPAPAGAPVYDRLAAFFGRHPG